VVEVLITFTRILLMRRLGIYSWFGYQMPLEQRLTMIKQAGFDTTCLWFGHEEEMVRDGQADKMPDLVRRIGLHLDNIHAPFWNHYLLWSESGETIKKIRQELTDTLKFCGGHQIAYMVAHFGGRDFPPGNENGLKIIRELVQQAEDIGVTIAAENGEGGNKYLDYIFEQIHSKNLAFCYDSSHDNISSEFRGSALQKWGKYLVTTHLSDNLGVDDDHLLPGKGAIDWDTVLGNFPKEAYQGVLMLEVDGPDASKGLTPERFLQIGYEWLREFDKKLG
jgi:sugar phosphate isomerase/epimerase